MVSIRPIHTSTTIIDLYNDDDRFKGNATGFFFIDDEKHLYLVTNKHVLYGKEYYNNTSPIINKIELILHTDVQNMSKNKKVKIPLFKNNKRIWFEHTDKTIDVILIPLKLDRTKYVILSMDESWIINTNNLIISFDKIFVMGYPYGWYDCVNNLPITRIGHLSSPFKVPFRGSQPIMLGDIETHKGMSGGPVIMELNDYAKIENGKLKRTIGSHRTILVGILSGQPVWNLIGITETISHSLIHIWFSDLILDILTNPC